MGERTGVDAVAEGAGAGRGRSWVRRILTSKAVYAVLGLSALAFVLLRWGDAVGGPLGLWARFGWWAAVVSVPFHALVAVTPFPSDVVAMSNGAIYGFRLGAALSWLGWFAASFVQYAIGRRAGRDFDVEGWLARSPDRLKRFPVDHPLFLILARFVPYVGGHLATLVPGAAGVPLTRYAWCSAVALIPQSLVMAGVGAGLLLL
ncbi:TVP38/TMEM64 family protein [Rhodocaloribacter sp.]